MVLVERSSDWLVLGILAAPGEGLLQVLVGRRLLVAQAQSNLLPGRGARQRQRPVGATPPDSADELYAALLV